MARMSIEDGLVMQIHPGSFRNHNQVIFEKYGPDSVGVLVSAKITNEENFLAQKFARACIGTNNVDHCARL